MATTYERTQLEIAYEQGHADGILFGELTHREIETRYPEHSIDWAWQLAYQNGMDDAITEPNS